MKEQTKIFVVTRLSVASIRVFSTDERPVGFFTDKVSAEYYCWSKKNDEYFYYTVKEIGPLEVSKDRDFQKFLKEKREKIEGEIKGLQDHAIQDTEEAAKLKKELESF